MDNLSSWTELFFEALNDIWYKIVLALPNLLGAILIFLIGWLAAKVLSRIVNKLLSVIKFDDLAAKVNASNVLEKANINLSPSKLISKLAYWLVLLLVFLTASETLGWQSFSSEVAKLISFLPQLFLAFVIFIIGSYIATVIRDILSGASDSLGLSTGRILSSFVYYIILIITCLTALKQAGVDTSFISSNMLLILGAILVTMSISYGLASRDIMRNILSAYASRNTFRKGMILEVGAYKGEVVSMDSAGLCLLLDNNEKVIFPAHILQKKTVRIIKDIE